MLTQSLRDPFAIWSPIPGSGAETKSARPGSLLRARRSDADRVRSAVKALTGGHGAVLTHEEKAWASITFTGTRHELVIEFSGADAVAVGEELIERLPDHEFAIPGQLVADATITKVDHRFGALERLEVTAVLLLLQES